MELGRKVQVYLDSSDFSNLCRLENNGLLNKLLEYRALGLVEYRFSIVHVLEGVAVTREYIEESRGRFEIMTELCGTQCLIPPFELIKLEAEPLEFSPFGENGEWLPLDKLDDLEIPSFVQTCKELLEEPGLNRQQRRVLAKQIFNSKGQLTPLAIKQLGNRPQELIRDFSERYPLSEAGINLVLNAAMGQASRQSVIQELKNSILLLNSFNEWPSKKWEEMRPILEWLRKQGSKLQSMLTQMKSQVDGVTEKSMALGMTEFEVAKNLKELDKKLMRELPRILLKALRVSAEAVSTISWERTPALMTVCGFAASLTRASSFAVRNHRSSKQSDFGDLLHSTYLPYVDLYRTDGFAGSQLRGGPDSEKIVVNLRSLQSAIEHKILRV